MADNPYITVGILDHSMEDTLFSYDGGILNISSDDKIVGIGKLEANSSQGCIEPFEEFSKQSFSEYISNLTSDKRIFINLSDFLSEENSNQVIEVGETSEARSNARVPQKEGSQSSQDIIGENQDRGLSTVPQREIQMPDEFIFGSPNNDNTKEEGVDLGNIAVGFAQGVATVFLGAALIEAAPFIAVSVIGTMFLKSFMDNMNDARHSGQGENAGEKAFVKALSGLVPGDPIGAGELYEGINFMTYESLSKEEKEIGIGAYAGGGIAGFGLGIRGRIRTKVKNSTIYESNFSNEELRASIKPKTVRAIKEKPQEEGVKVKPLSVYEKAVKMFYKTFDETPALKKIWNECAKNRPNNEKGYNNARAQFWKRLNNPKTATEKYVRKLLENAGFEFKGGIKGSNAPLLQGYGNVPKDTVRLSLDHVFPKALSNDYLSAENIKFILQRDNSQMSHQTKYSH